MFRKMIVLVLVGLFLFAGQAGMAKAADQGGKGSEPAATSAKKNCGWTYMKFAEFLAQKYGIVIAKSTTMSDADRYTALANALSQKGITYFSSAKATDMVKCCDAAGVLYDVVGAKGPEGTCDLKINYLIKNGFLKLGSANSTPCDALCNIEDAFGTPVAEKFRPPFNPPPTNPPHEDPERPSSRT